MPKAELLTEIKDSRGEFEIMTTKIVYREGYRVDIWRAVLSENAKEVSGFIFRINPGGSTRVVRVVDEKAEMVDQPVWGSGYFLLHRDGEVVVEEVDAGTGMASYVYEYGDTIVWIAGENGLDVLNITTPPFDNFEEVVPVDDESLPAEFWTHYHDLVDN